MGRPNGRPPMGQLYPAPPFTGTASQIAPVPLGVRIHPAASLLDCRL
jgi:hypothetical protein